MIATKLACLLLTILMVDVLSISTDGRYLRSEMETSRQLGKDKGSKDKDKKDKDSKDKDSKDKDKKDKDSKGKDSKDKDKKDKDSKDKDSKDKDNKDKDGGDNQDDTDRSDGVKYLYQPYEKGYISPAGVYESRKCIIMGEDAATCDAGCGGCCRIYVGPFCDAENKYDHMPCACSGKTIPRSFWDGTNNIIDVIVESPSSTPSASPTESTSAPTSAPTSEPTAAPTTTDRSGSDGLNIPVNVTSEPTAQPTLEPTSEPTEEPVVTCKRIYGTFETNGIIEEKPCIDMGDNPAYEDCAENCGGCCRVYNDPWCDKNNGITHMPCACSPYTKPLDSWYECS